MGDKKVISVECHPSQVRAVVRYIMDRYEGEDLSLDISARMEFKQPKVYLPSEIKPFDITFTLSV